MLSRVADYISTFFADKGIHHVFTLSGGGMMYLQDAFSRESRFTYICHHHEQAAGFAADANARITGLPGVCFVTAGPGITNAVTAIVSSYQDSIPVIYIAGQAKRAETIRGNKAFGLRQWGTFEVDSIPIVSSITKYSAFVDKASDIRFHLENAWHEALEGRPGPTFLEIPLDVQGALADVNQLQAAIEPQSPSLNDETFLAPHILEKLRSFRKPLILAGHGIRCAQRRKEFRSWIEKLEIPVVTTSMAKDLLSYDHPLFIGHPGVKGDRAANFAIQEADGILSLGSSLHITTTGYELCDFAPQAYKIEIDLDASVLLKNKNLVNEQYRISCESFLQKMLELGGSSLSISSWRHQCRALKSQWSVFSEPHERSVERMNYYDFFESFSKVCPDYATIVADAGSAFYVTGQAFRSKANQNVILPGALAQMGFTLPAATGAQLARPTSLVVGITGDGSFQTNVQELAVWKQYGLNVKLIVLNNDGYACIRKTQRQFFNGFISGSDASTGVFLPDVEKICSAYELPYWRAQSLGSLSEDLQKFLSSEGATVLEIFTVQAQDFLPYVASTKREDGSLRSARLDQMLPEMREQDATRKPLSETSA